MTPPAHTPVIGDAFGMASPFDWFFVSQAELRKLVSGTGWMVGRSYESSSNPLYVAVLRLTR